MKVLLFVVASIVVIQAFKPADCSDEKGILDIVQDVIYGLLQQAIGLLNTLRNTLTNILQAAIPLLAELLQGAENLLLTIADGVLQQIEDVAEIHLPCVVNQEKNVQQILATAQKDIQSCGRTAFEAIEGVRNRTTSFELEIANEVTKIKQLLTQCFSINPIEIMKCVIGQSREIDETLSQIAINAKEAIKLAAIEVGKIVQDARSCVANIIEGVRNQLDDVRKDIVNCIESQKPN